MTYPIYVVDAFTQSPFSGNPAAVLVLTNENSLTEKTYQKLAAEMNLSETAIVSPLANTHTNIFTSTNQGSEQENNQNLDGQDEIPTFSLRWFTPVTEVHFCGHATLATSHILFSKYKDILVPAHVNKIQFHTLYGSLTVEQVESGKYRMLFPQGQPEKANIKKETLDKILNHISLNPSIDQVLDVMLCKKTKKLMIRFETIESVLKAKPKCTELLNFDFDGDDILCTYVKGIIVNTQVPPQTISFENEATIDTNTDTTTNTTRNTITNTSRDTTADTTVEPLKIRKLHHSITHLQQCGYDFVSRYFSPWNGIPEDPVNGSGHTVQAVYWSSQLEKSTFKAYQLSEREGELYIQLNDDGSMYLSGYAVITLEGQVYLD